MQDVADLVELQPTLIPVNRSPSSAGFRVSGTITDAFVFRSSGLLARGAGNPGPATCIHISDIGEAGRGPSSALWLRSDASPYETMFDGRARCTTVRVPIASLSIDLSQFDLTRSVAVAAPPIALHCLRSLAAIGSTDSVSWAMAPAGAIDKYLIGIAGILITAIIDERSNQFLDQQSSFLRSRALALIDTQFFDPALTPLTIARKLKVSLRTLHRAFEDHPSVASSLRSRRVQHATDLLSTESSVQLPISDIARQSGFTSIATFERSFSQAHDRSPRRYRQQIR